MGRSLTREERKLRELQKVVKELEKKAEQADLVLQSHPICQVIMNGINNLIADLREELHLEPNRKKL